MVGDDFTDLDSVDFANVSFAILFGYGHRIAERHLNKTVFINLHGSLLPLGRGPHPHIWNWINGHPHGVTIHKMSAEIDKGPIIVQRQVELKPWEHSINSTMYALVDSATELFRVARPGGNTTGVSVLAPELNIAGSSSSGPLPWIGLPAIYEWAEMADEGG